MINQQQIQILRDLAKQVYELSQQPENELKRRDWIALNDLHPNRPMVIIDQIPWSEINVDGSLTCVCEDPFWKRQERDLRRTLFKMKYFPADFVVPGFVEVPKAIVGFNDFGIKVQEDTSTLVEGSEVKGHYYHDVLGTDEAVEAIKIPRPYEDKERSRQILTEAQEVYGDSIPVVQVGVNPSNSIWDWISTWRGVEEPLYDMMERPEFIHKTMEILTNAMMVQLDHLEAENLLAPNQQYIHCTGAYTEQLPKEGFDPDHVRAKDTWCYGLAQMLDTVSPAMFNEFELEYANKWYERFGLVYYGCCDALHHKMKYVRNIPNVRKISMSPWSNAEIGAAEIGKDFVFSSKPSPAFVGAPSWDAEAVRNDLLRIKAACDKNGCPVEFILKDISTCCNDLNRLVEWNKIAMDIVKA